MKRGGKFLGYDMPNPTNDKIHALEEKFKYMEVHETPGLDAINMCMVLSLVIPPKLKVPDFEKYKGVCCSKTYCHALILSYQISLFIFNAFALHTLHFQLDSSNLK